MFENVCETINGFISILPIYIMAHSKKRQEYHSSKEDHKENFFHFFFVPSFFFLCRRLLPYESRSFFSMLYVIQI